MNENVPGNPAAAGLQDAWNWSNWCANPTSDLEVLVQASGMSLNKTLLPVSPQPLSAAPACRDRSAPSTIRTTVPPTLSWIE